MAVLARLLAMLAVVLAGTGLRAVGILDDSRTGRLNALAYYIALPALIFTATYDRSVGELLSLALLAGLLVVLLATAALAVDPATLTASVVMFGTPTAVSTFVYATELGGDEGVASLNVFVTTVASIGSLFVLIRLIG